MHAPDWGGPLRRGWDRLPAPLPAPPENTLKVEEQNAEQMFRSLLNDQQLAELDRWLPSGGGGYTEAVVNFETDQGETWAIRFLRYAAVPDYFQAQLLVRGTPRCFHAMSVELGSLNSRMPYVAAIGILLKAQQHSAWIDERAGLA